MNTADVETLLQPDPHCRQERIQGAHGGRPVPGEPEALWASLPPLVLTTQYQSRSFLLFLFMFLLSSHIPYQEVFPQDVCVGENLPEKGLGELENRKLPIATCFWHSEGFISGFGRGFTNLNKANWGCASYLIA